jgi:hypothetical protein
MTLGIPTSAFTQLHALISLIGIVSGIVVLHRDAERPSRTLLVPAVTLTALYLNVFVAGLQAFQKVVAILRSLTPTQAAPPVCNCPEHRLSRICRVGYRCGQAISSVATCEHAISLRSALASSTSTLRVT